MQPLEWSPVSGMEFLAIFETCNFQSISQDIYRLCRKQAQVQTEKFQLLQFQNIDSQCFLQHAIWYFNLCRAGEATDDCLSLKAQFCVNLCLQWFENCQIKDPILLKALEWPHCIMEALLDIRKYCRTGLLFSSQVDLGRSVAGVEMGRKAKADVFLQG